jgi:predicted dehydrogenase
MVRVGVIGYGRWGPNLARCVASERALVLCAICDTSPSRLQAAAVQHSNVRLESDPEAVINDPTVDAVLLATPATNHYRSARGALRAGKHVLVEKPLALQSDHVLRLIEEADRRRLVLMIDHTYNFSSAIRSIQQAMQSGYLGAICSLESLRVNQFGGPQDCNVLWDLAYHDLSIIDYIFSQSALAVSAVGSDCNRAFSQRCADMTVYFANDFAAKIHVNWAGPAKLRTMRLVGSGKSLIFDDLEPETKIKICNSASDSNGVDHLQRETWLGGIGGTEPLRTVVNHFANCILNGERPLSDGDAALRITLILEAADRSMSNAGRIVSLSMDATASERSSPAQEKLFADYGP